MVLYRFRSHLPIEPLFEPRSRQWFLMVPGTTREAWSVAGYLPSALYENFWPATEASYIRPPFATVNTAIPL